MDEKSRFIRLDRQGRSAQNRVELSSAKSKSILSRENDNNDVHSRNDHGFREAPTFGNDPSSAISRDGVTVLTHRNENGAGFRAAVWPNVEAKPFTGPSRPLVEDPRNVAPRSDALRLPESETLSAPFVVGHGNQYFFFSSEVLSLIRPLARRLFRMALPPLVFMRALNPNFLTRRVLLG